MPTPVGHSLAGIAVALAGEHGGRLRDFRGFLARPTTVVCVALATLPDVDLLFPGFHGTATHSVTATIVVAIVAAAMATWATSGTSGTTDAFHRIAWSAVVMYAAAHGSHILLDWLNCDLSERPGIQYCGHSLIAGSPRDGASFQERSAATSSPSRQWPAT